MEKDTPWVVVDTETSGLRCPIYCVEIAAQKMKGWNIDGEPFRVFINHNIELEYGAVRVHGYTREYLKQIGCSPLEAYEKWRDYVGELPLVAHNLKYDWDRVLFPEYQRLGIQPIGQQGFCSLALSRRLLKDVSRHGLQPLSEVFDLYESSVAHKAINDVHATVKLLQTILRPRLAREGLFSFEEIKNMCGF